MSAPVMMLNTQASSLPTCGDTNANWAKLAMNRKMMRGFEKVTRRP
jgi:hypothetical protein